MTPPPPPGVRRHFLPWDRPLLQQAAEFLASGWDRGGPLDLSSQLVVVPTRQSGRRLREALAELAASHGRAAFPPRVMTPDMLIAPAPSANLATRAESLLAWAEVFRGLDLESFREVFPVDPPGRTFAWSIRAARQFADLQRTLAESGLRLAEVAGRTGGDFPEAARWRQMGELENRYLEKLATIGRTDPQAARIAAAASRRVPGVGRIVLLAVPDPVPLSLSFIAAQVGAVQVDVVVYAPESEAGAFDEWGSPSEPAWVSRTLELADFERCVRICSDPAAQADRVVELAAGHGNPDGALGVGAADVEVLPFLEAALAQAGIAAFNPGGLPRRREGFCHLVASLAALADDPTFAAVETLARCPDFMDYLAGALGESFTVESWLAGLDEIHARHLPGDLATARIHAAASKGYPGLAAALDLVEEARAALAGGGFSAGGSRVLSQVFAARHLDLDRNTDARFEDSASAWMDTVRECAAAGERLPGFGGADLWRLALEMYAEGERTEDKPDGALELQGWLELLFEDAPHLVIAGCNDGSLPGEVTGDPFLPEGMRAMLGLGGNGQRFARDAYVLQALAACRSRTGRIEILVGKVSEDGDPLRPSRLLFRCADPELPRRVEFLFRPVGKARPSPPWGRAWVLSPGIVEGRRLERLPATAIREYLACPFRFYLKRALGIEAFDPQKAELSSLDFGTLCHDALEAMGAEGGLRNCRDTERLRSFLTERLDGIARERYGSGLPMPLMIQLESARQRLARAAEVQAGLRAEGWVIEQTEKKYEVQIGGLAVTAKIDRIDRHERTGNLRVIDYKTGDKSEDPLRAHARSAKGPVDAPDFARFAAEDRAMVWTDLQLPIYREALKTERGLPESPFLETAYFNLPKAVGDTGLRIWSDYTPDIHAAAMRCAEGVAAAVAKGEFWPPAEDSKYDDSNGFAGFFHRGVAESVDSGFAGRVRHR
jgi:ATP-dependent helicase/nuclease subunit B